MQVNCIFYVGSCVSNRNLTEEIGSSPDDGAEISGRNLMKSAVLL